MPQNELTERKAVFVYDGADAWNEDRPEEFTDVR